MAFSEKHLTTLEYDKVLDRLAQYCAFSVSRELILALRPTANLLHAQRLQAETAEAVALITAQPEVTIGGARDIREAAFAAERGATLDAASILDVRATVLAGRDLKRTLTRLADPYPNLAGQAYRIDECPGLVDAITNTLDERGEVLDSASPRLANLRVEIRVAYNRLMQKLQGMVSSSENAQFLQEALITQRSGRYVIPLKAEFKGRIPGIVHDRSSSGATIFIEPMATVELNNQYRELQLEEQEEVRRILAELSARIGGFAHELIENVAALADLDVAFAKAKYALALRAMPPTFVEWRTPRVIRNAQGQQAVHPGSRIKMQQVRHPLLDPRTVVPIDVELAEDVFVVVVTGPNTGGKTVALKTIGLAVLMAQSGLHIPAKSGAELTVFDGVFADIGDEQSIEQSLSTFSSHITNIISILDTCSEQSLVLLDELGAGTDPEEGSLLAQAMLNHLVERGATTFATTHYSQLKLFATSSAGITNASVEFDLDSLAPTYRLMIGLPGSSHAIEIAERLGLKAEIIAKARSQLAQAEVQTEALLADISRKQKQLEAELALAEAVKKDVLETERDLLARLEHIEQERRGVLRDTREAAEAELETLRKEVRQLRGRLQAAALPLDELNAVLATADKLEAEAEKALAPGAPLDAALKNKGPHTYRLGDTVWVAALNTEGVIQSLTEREAEVQIGRLRLRTALDDLAPGRPAVDAPTAADKRKKKAAAEKPERSEAPPLPLHPSPGMELDIRGERVETGLERLDRYIDAAAMARLPWVRIIHGKGTGKLRQAVRETLTGHPLVTKVKNGEPNEGGEGVTVAYLREDE